jgi:hypothetical protein
MRILSLFLVLCFVSISCKNAPAKVEQQSYIKIEKHDWILGDWTNISTETQSYEHWERTNDSTYLGLSVTMKDGDTIFAERMRLFEEKNRLKLYIETVGLEPNPVLFTELEGTTHPFTFVNPKNEFPSEIVYSRPEPNKIHAWVSGTINGEPQTIDFYFTRE